MALNWLTFTWFLAGLAAPMFLPKAPAPAPLPPMSVVVETSRGPIAIDLLTEKAPAYTRHFLREVDWGSFRSEGVWKREPGRFVQLGSPATDIHHGPTTVGQLGRSFETTPGPKLPGSLVMNRRFDTDGDFIRTEYALITGAEGDFPGAVIGIVTAGMDVARELRQGDVIHDISIR